MKEPCVQCAKCDAKFPDHGSGWIVCASCIEKAQKEAIEARELARIAALTEIAWREK